MTGFATSNDPRCKGENFPWPPLKSPKSIGFDRKLDDWNDYNDWSLWKNGQDRWVRSLLAPNLHANAEVWIIWMTGEGSYKMLLAGNTWRLERKCCKLQAQLGQNRSKIKRRQDAHCAEANRESGELTTPQPEFKAFTVAKRASPRSFQVEDPQLVDPQVSRFPLQDPCWNMLKYSTLEFIRISDQNPGVVLLTQKIAGSCGGSCSFSPDSWYFKVSLVDIHPAIRYQISQKRTEGKYWNGWEAPGASLVHLLQSPLPDPETQAAELSHSSKAVGRRSDCASRSAWL